MRQQATADPLTPFLGLWLLRREIDDRHGGMRLAFAGTLRVERTPGGAVAAEEGVLTAPGRPPIQATRRTLWRAAGGRIEVLFEDGRPFHVFDPGRTSSEVRHDCGADLYRGRYDFAGWPEWRLIWRVTGPRKDWISETLAVPEPGLASGPGLGHNLADAIEGVRA